MASGLFASNFADFSLLSFGLVLQTGEIQAYSTADEHLAQITPTNPNLLCCNILHRCHPSTLLLASAGLHSRGPMLYSIQPNKETLRFIHDLVAGPMKPAYQLSSVVIFLAIPSRAQSHLDMDNPSAGQGLVL